MREERVALPRRERTQAKPEPGEEQLASPILALQRQAGNRAVGALLARDEKKGDAGAKTPSGATMSLPEPVGVLSLTSVSLESGGRVTASLPMSEKVAKLNEWVMTGASLGTVVITLNGVGFAVTDAVATSVQISSRDQIVTFTIAGAVGPKQHAENTTGTQQSDHEDGQAS